jgi:hypothetical protein
LLLCFVMIPAEDCELSSIMAPMISRPLFEHNSCSGSCHRERARLPALERSRWPPIGGHADRQIWA